MPPRSLRVLNPSGRPGGAEGRPVRIEARVMTTAYPAVSARLTRRQPKTVRAIGGCHRLAHSRQPNARPGDLEPAEPQRYNGGQSDWKLAPYVK